MGKWKEKRAKAQGRKPRPVLSLLGHYKTKEIKMLGTIQDNQPEKTIKKVGRPKLPEDQRKKKHSIKLKDETWELLATIGGGNRALAIEELVEDYFARLRKEVGKQ